MKENLIPLEKALELILDNIIVLGLEKVDLISSLGRVIGEDIYASRAIPPWDNSAMDGYAVKYKDIDSVSSQKPEFLTVVENLAAGYHSDRILKNGEAIKIMTGAPIPSGADTVVMVEDTEQEGSRVKIFISPKSGENTRKAGEDVKKGDLVISRDSLIGPAEVGMMASLGRSFIHVFQKPQVAILSTGDELVDVDGKTGRDKIINSNSYTLATQTKECGAIAIQLGIAQDRKEDLEKKLGQGIRADMIISSGGVSVGDYDFVKDVLKKMGMEMKFWNVAMKPGKPLAFGTIFGKPTFGLPGNPVSSMISFEQFVRPALLKMLGHKKIYRPVVDAIITENIEKKTGRKNFIRARLTSRNGAYHVNSTGEQGSGILLSMVKANGLIILPEETSRVRAGETVKVQLLDKSFTLSEKPNYP